MDDLAVVAYKLYSIISKVAEEYIIQTVKDLSKQIK